MSEGIADLLCFSGGGGVEGRRRASRWLGRAQMTPVAGPENPNLRGILRDLCEALSLRVLRGSAEVSSRVPQDSLRAFPVVTLCF